MLARQYAVDDGDARRARDAVRSAVQAMFQQMRAAFMAGGADMATATQRAYAAIFGMVQRQASMVSFVGLFQLLGIIFLVIIPLVLLMRRPGHGGPAVGAH